MVVVKSITFQDVTGSRFAWLGLAAAAFALGGLYLGANMASWGNIIAFAAGMTSAFFLANESYGAENFGVLGSSVLVAVRLPGHPLQTARFTPEHRCRIRALPEGLIELRSDRQRVLFGYFAAKDQIEALVSELQDLARKADVLKADMHA